MIKSPVIIDESKEFLIHLLYQLLGDNFSISHEESSTYIKFKYLDYYAYFKIDVIDKEITSSFISMMKEYIDREVQITLELSSNLEDLINSLIQNKLNIAINCNKFFEIFNDKPFIHGMLRAVPCIIPLTYADSQDLNDSICNFETKYYIGDIELYPNYGSTFDHQKYVREFHATISFIEFRVLKSYLDLSLEDYCIVSSVSI